MGKGLASSLADTERRTDMDFYAHINGKDYPIEYGWTLTEELSETLDTAMVNLPHVVGSIEIKPYDDIVIHSYAPNDDGTSNLPPRPLGKIFKAEEGNFYRHMLIYSYTRDKVVLDGVNGKNVWNYRLELVSETKGLETVQLPNKTITQPQSLAVGDKNQISGVSFSIGDDEQTKLTLPYSVVNSWTDGVVIRQKQDPSYVFRWFKWFAFAGDTDPATSDYLQFTSIESEVVKSTQIILPDCNLSGVTVAFGQTDFWVNHLLSTSFYTAKKHWIIRNKDIAGGSWGTRDAVVDTIQSYLSGTDYNSIVNYSVADERDITTTEKVASIPASFPVNGNYEVYLYIEPQLVTIRDKNGAAQGTFNIFGMTNNSNGTKSPLEQIGGAQVDTSKPFLAKWSFSVVTSKAGDAKDAITVYEAVRQAIQLYSPYVKVRGEQNAYGYSWHYERKYSIHELTANEFKKYIAPENQFNYPNLRDFITRLFYVADCIPVVHDGVITHMSLSQRNPIPFQIADGVRSFEQYSMDGQSYCDRLLRNYTDGLSKDNVVSCVERVGFKNKNDPTLTLENLQIELDHPIYRIKKVYMCYYKRYVDSNGYDYMKLCKQDITPLVLLNSQRGLLSREWVDAVDEEPANINELAKYYYATVGYDIGSTTITGWGTTYSHPTALFWKTKKTTIENILEYMMTRYPYGVIDYNDESTQGMSQVGVFDSNASEDRVAQNASYENVIITQSDILASKFKDRFGTYTQRLKSLMFLIEYDGFISSAIIASKEHHDGNVVSRDNASSSLSFVESDGINQREKANRLGNAVRTVPARHKSLDDVQEISQVWDDSSVIGGETTTEPSKADMEHKDEVLYKRSISFHKDYLSVSYYLCRNYVIRNYFTSVFAKHRPFALASYEESVERQEVKNLQILISPDKWYAQTASNSCQIYLTKSYMDRIFSFFEASSYDSNGNLVVETGIDRSFYAVFPSLTEQYRGQVGLFASDVQKFNSGNSFCFSICMKDNVSAGVFVGDFNKNLGSFIGVTWGHTWNLVFSQSSLSWSDAQDAMEASVILTGAAQNWYMFPVDPKTGMLYNMAFSVGFNASPIDIYGVSMAAPFYQYNIAEAQLLPLMDSVVHNLLPDKYIYFGKELNGKKVGAGYPRLRFTKAGGDHYKVDFSQQDTTKPTWSNSIIQSDSPITTGFGDCDGNSVNARERIEALATSIFRGSEKEGVEEQPFCVFKDGKERIVSTLQLEPISEDNRVRFSPYMAKMSNLIGGKDKNYEDRQVIPNILFDFSIANIRSEIHDIRSTEGSYRDYALFSAPVLCIGVPDSAVATLNISMATSEERKTFSVSGANGRSYSITVYRIRSQLINDEYQLSVDCVISINGVEVYSEYVTFKEVSGKTQNDTIDGRTGTSNFPIYPICNMFSVGYRSFALVEDGAFFDQQNTLIAFNAKAPSNNGIYFPENGTPASTSFWLRKREVSSPSYSPYSFGDSPIYWQSTAANPKNYTNITMNMQRRFSDNIYYDTVTDATLHETIVIGKEAGDPIVKTKNMFWVLCNSLMSAGDEYESIDATESLEGKGTVYNLRQFAPNDEIRIVQAARPLNMYKMSITLPESVNGPASLRLYYLEDNKYRFVFGVNVDRVIGNQPKRSDCVYPTNDTGATYELYISVLDSRSKTVFDPETGEPSYEMMNFAGKATGELPYSEMEVCVAK